MQRAGPLLRTVAACGGVTKALIDTLWNACMVDRKAEALTAVVDMIEHSKPAVLQEFMGLVSTVMGAQSVPAQLTSIVDILGAVVMRCKTILLESDVNYRIITNATTGISSGDVEVEEEEEEEVENKKKEEAEAAKETLLTFRIYGTGIENLTKFILDEKKMVESAAAQSLLRLESVVVVKKQPDGGKPFPWRMQFFLVEPLVACAVRNIAANISIASMLRLLQILIIGWPAAPKGGKDRGAESDLGEGVFNTRSKLVQHIESKYNVVEVVTKAILDLKTAYDSDMFTLLRSEAAQSQYQDLSLLKDLTTSNDVTTVTDIRTRHFPLQSSTLNASLVELKIHGSHLSYIEQLNRLFNFLHILGRCSDALRVSIESIEKINSRILLHAVTVNEHDSVISFYDRFISTYNSSATNTANAAEEKGDDAASTGSRKKYLVDKESIRWVYLNVLCDEKKSGLARSGLLTLKTYQCVEKWFLWLNADEGLVREDGANFTIIGNPASLIGMDIFLQLILNCPSDAVALQAVKFLTLLPQHFSEEHTACGVTTRFRKQLLDQCMNELQCIHRANQRREQEESSSPNILSRTLMLLEGILEVRKEDLFLPSSPSCSVVTRSRNPCRTIESSRTVPLERVLPWSSRFPAQARESSSTKGTYPCALTRPSGISCVQWPSKFTCRFLK